MKTKTIATTLALGVVLASQAYALQDYETHTDTTTTTTKNDPSVLDQSAGTNKDVEVTRRIRENLGKTDLSTSAKNIEVITLNNTVTLRGTVSSQAEKQKIYDTAQNAAGTRAISNELTVDTATRR